MRFVSPDAEPDLRPHIAAAERELLGGGPHRLRTFTGPIGDLDEWARRLRDADGVLLNWAMPGEVFERCPALRVVSFAGTGVERYVDLERARAREVAVCNVPSYGANAVAEHAFALIFAVARQVPRSDRALRANRWEPRELVELRGRRLGVVGLGPIGARAIELGQALGMDVAAWTRNATPERAAAHAIPLLGAEELFRRSDVVSLHVAHTPETEGMISRPLLAQLPPGAILVNTARAELVDPEALLECLNSGALAGAGLDVFSPEPPMPDDPLVAHERVVCTPHSAYLTTPAARELYRAAVGNLVAFAAGAPRNVVT